MEYVELSTCNSDKPFTDNEERTDDVNQCIGRIQFVDLFVSGGGFVVTLANYHRSHQEAWKSRILHEYLEDPLRNLL